MKAIRVLIMVWMVLVTLGAVTCAVAQTYPAKPIQMIVGFPPGGSTDIAARMVAQKLGDAVGKPIVVDNRPGAGSNIGAELAAKASPDGYTFLVYTIANAINYSLYKNLPFDMLNSFAPVTQLTSVTSFLVVHPSLPVNSVKDLIALAKSKPGQLHFASSGIGNSPHLAGEMFKIMAGVDMVHIPYKGTGPELTELLAGHVKIAFEPTPQFCPTLRRVS